MKTFVKQFCPPIIWRGLSELKQRLSIPESINSDPVRPDSQVIRLEDPTEQDLDVYWDPEMAEILETWGEGTAWHELKFLTAGLTGKVLDIACGTGKNIDDLCNITKLEIYGCDISDFLINKAIERGIPRETLRVCDATKTGYGDNFFDYSYSIGSLEHFTDKGLDEVISEVYRITSQYSFHMIPISNKDVDEGWIKTKQSYYCNSVNWWVRKFKGSYESVTVLDSLWKGEVTNGKWFICAKMQPQRKHDQV